MLRTAFSIAALACTLALSGCGGGGGGAGDGLPCGGSSTLSLAPSYEVNGSLVELQSSIVLARGLAVVATPKVLGLPGACLGASRWTFSASQPVPDGMVFDAKTGVFSGMPTARASFPVRLQLEVDGYTNTISAMAKFLM